MASRKKIGNDAEKEFTNLMFKNGWWAHIFADKVAGQPFDIVISKDNTAWFFDAKNIKDKDYLLHSRIEENQHNSFKMLVKRGTDRCGFACKFDDGWYLIKYNKMNFDNKKTHKSEMSKL